MSTLTAAPPLLPAEWLDHGYHLPRVDLLPPEIRVRRRLASLQRTLGAALLALGVLLLAVYVLSLRESASAAVDLGAVTTRTAELQAEQAQYTGVPQAQTQVDAARGALRQAMATDVRWYQYLTDLALSHPDGVWLTNLSATLAPTAPAGAASSALGTPGVGVITFSGTSDVHPQVADWLEALDATPGLADASISTSERSAVGERPVVTFESTVTVTPDALSGRFEQEAS